MIKNENTNYNLALDNILRKNTRGIPSLLLHVMEYETIERLAGTDPGSYLCNPKSVYISMQRNIGTCAIDQYLWDNPLTMGNKGYKEASKGATTGIEQVILDGMIIDSPESVVEHLEKNEFPRLQKLAAEFDENVRVREILNTEEEIQLELGSNILKSGYGFIKFPLLAYYLYGYVNYFCAYALYPDVIEKHFALQADWHKLNNAAAARAYTEGKLPPLYRLDFDMADSRGTLVDINSLDRLWFPHFARAIEPMLNTNVNLIWHCDGNLMEMLPRLIDCGIRGFQGFQYEDGMEYEKICQMKCANGDDLIIVAGVSVTRTLPFGTPADVKKELDYLVKYGPKTGLFLGGSSSIAPGVSWDNIQTLVEGLEYYRINGRSGVLSI